MYCRTGFDDFGVSAPGSATLSAADTDPTSRKVIFRVRHNEVWYEIRADEKASMYKILETISTLTGQPRPMQISFYSSDVDPPEAIDTEDRVRSRLRDFLTARSLTQREVAHKIGVSQAVLSMFMRCKYSGDSDGLIQKLKIYLDRMAAGGDVSSAAPTRTHTPASGMSTNSIPQSILSSSTASVADDVAAGAAEPDSLLDAHDLRMMNMTPPPVTPARAHLPFSPAAPWPPAATLEPSAFADPPQILTPATRDRMALGLLSPGATPSTISPNTVTADTAIVVSPAKRQATAAAVSGAGAASESAEPMAPTHLPTL